MSTRQQNRTTRRRRIRIAALTAFAIAFTVLMAKSPAARGELLGMLLAPLENASNVYEWFSPRLPG